MADKDFVVKNSLTVNTAFTANGSQFALGANVVGNTSSIYLGNSTVNAVSNSTALRIVNASTSANLTSSDLKVGTSTVNTTVLAAGSNVVANTSAYFVGNSTVNATYTSTLVQVTNSSTSSNLTSIDLKIGTSTVNSTVLAEGSNVVVNTSAYFVGNSTVNATHTSTLVQVINATGSANLSAVDLKVGTSVVNASVLAAGANVIANTSAYFVGNSTVNTVVTSSTITTGNSTVNTVVNSTAFSGTANNTTNFASGNSTANVVANSTIFKLANATSTANLTPADLTIGTTVVNGAAVAVGTGIVANTTRLVVNTTAAIWANGGIGTSGQTLYSNGTTNYWAAAIGTVNLDAQYVWSNNQTFSNSITVGNSTVNTYVIGGSITMGNSTVNSVVNSTALSLVSGAITVSSGTLTVGNSTVNAFVNSTAIVVGNSTVNGTITSNTTATYFTGIASQAVSLIGGVSIPASYVQNTDSRTLSGNLNFTAANVNFASAAYVGANVSVTTSAVTAGNSTVNATHNSTLLQVANSTSTANLNAAGLTVGASLVNTTALAAGSNVIINTSTVYIGNSTANVVANSTFVQVSNSSSYMNLTPVGMQVGYSTVNTTYVAVGANVLANTSSVFVGNSTINTNMTAASITINASNVSINATAINVGNSTAYGRIQKTFMSVVDPNNNTRVIIDPIGGLETGNVSINTYAYYFGDAVTIVSNTTGTVYGAYLSPSAVSANSPSALLSLGTYGNSSTGGTRANTSLISIGNSTVNASINATAYTGSANNSSYLGGTLAASYVQNTDSRTLSGNINFTGTNVYFSTAAYIGTNTFTVGTGTYFVANGNVGIGVATPGVKLYLASASDIAQRIDTSGTTTAAFLSIRNGSGTTSSLTSYTEYLNNDTNNQSWRVGTYGSNDFNIYNAKTSTYAYTFAANGNFGVGNSSPAHKFSVDGTALVNTSVTIGNSTVNAIVNSTVYTGSANNSSYLGTVAAASYVQNTDSRTLSGNLNFTGTNVYFSSAVYVGANAVVNTSTVYVGNSTVNTKVTAGSLTINGSSVLTSIGASYVQNTDSRTLSGNLNFTGANVTISGSNLTFGSTTYVNATKDVQNYIALSSTGIQAYSNGNSSTALFGWNTFNGKGVEGQSNTGPGVQAFSIAGNGAVAMSNTGTGLFAASNTGIPFIAAQGNFTGTTELFRVSSNGNVGINKTSPAYRLDLVTSTNGNDGAWFYNSNTGASAQATMTVQTNGASGFSMGQAYSSKNGFIYLADNAKMELSTNATVAMTIAANSNIGIGTGSGSPKAPLVITPSTFAGSLSPNKIRFYDDGANNVYGIGLTSGSMDLISSGLIKIAFNNSTTNTITSFAQFQAGQLSLNGTNGTTALLVSGASKGFRVFPTTGGTNIEGVDNTGIASYQPLNIGGSILTFNASNVEKMRMSAAGGFSVGTTADPGAGAIYATGNITAYYSDRRLKEIISTIPNALDKVNALSGIVYKNNEVAEQFGFVDDSEQLGVIAQEVQAVAPQAVKAAPFDLDENGDSKSGENYLTVQYEKLVPLLIEAIKELKAEIDQLKGSK